METRSSAARGPFFQEAHSVCRPFRPAAATGVSLDHVNNPAAGGQTTIKPRASRCRRGRNSQTAKPKMAAVVPSPQFHGKIARWLADCTVGR